MVIKNSRRGISIINILIIIGLILLAYLIYTQSLDNKVKTELANPQPTIEPKVNQASPIATSTKSSPKNKIPAPITIPPKTPAPETTPPTPPASQKGYYRNNTYAYEISFPTNWPIKIRSENNISLGTVPPKNGQGAITIEVAAGDSSNEIKEARAEAAKYPGLVSLTEETFSLAGVTGTKLTLNNFLAKTKDIYILLVKNGFNYIIKYSEKSAEFSRQAEQALTTFKFF